MVGKPSLTISRCLKWMSPWNPTLMRFLIASGCFAIEYEDFPFFPIGRRWRNFSLFRLNGMLAAVDTWDSNSMVECLDRAGYFQGVLRDVRALLKISMQAYDPYLEDFSNRTGIAVSPWTMFPDSSFPLEAFQWQSPGHKFTANLTGNNRRCGRPRRIA